MRPLPDVVGVRTRTNLASSVRAGVWSRGMVPRPSRAIPTREGGYMPVADNPLFKLVSLRGPLDGLVVDPDDDDDEDGGVDLGIAHDADASEARNRLAGRETLDRAQLDRLGLARFHALLETAHDDPPEALAALEPSHGTTLADYVRSNDFADAYREVTESWLALVLGGKDGDLGRHEELLRAAHVGVLLRDSPNTLRAPRTLRRLLAAPVVLPRRWHAGRLRRKGRYEAAAARPLEPPRAATMELREEYQELEGRIAARDELQRKAHAAHRAWRRAATEADEPAAAPRRRRSGGLLRPLVEALAGSVRQLDARRDTARSHALDDRYYDALSADLAADEQAEFDRVLGALRRRPTAFDDLSSALDPGELVLDANRRCGAIVIAGDEPDDLPDPVPHDPLPERPSVRAVGWGDLVVVRERLVGYEAHEIAHVENVLPGEEKVREHERTRTTEEMIETERTEETEKERDLQTTDRNELQTESQSTIDQEFSVEAGVNTSGRYGLTEVQTSLDVGFQQSRSESQSTSISLAREVVSRAVERVFESVRELRRLTITEQVRELNTHAIRNVAAAGGPAPTAFAGLYLWVEKVHEVELREYGTRLMVEFHVPEPAVSLLERQGSGRTNGHRPRPFRIGPSDVKVSNYLCLASQYGVTDLEPPPAPVIDVGWQWASMPDEDTNEDTAEDTVADSIGIPDGYRPVAGTAIVRAHPAWAQYFEAYLAVGGTSVIDLSGAAGMRFDFDLDAADEWRSGVPVSLLAHAHFDKTAVAQVRLECERTPEALTAWRLRTWERIREAHTGLVAEYERAQEQQRLDDQMLLQLAERPEPQNRDIEREELKKWAIKAMRLTPFDFDAIVQVDEFQEVDPGEADVQAPVVRFFEEAFEWRQMSYFLYPYFWGRRNAWRLRMSLTHDDARHAEFLRSGAARVIVPATPGYEARILSYLESDPDEDELIRISEPVPDEPPPGSEFEDLWLELLVLRNEQLALGSGTLTVANGSPNVTINDDSSWLASERDLGRELYLAGERYVVEEVGADRATVLDRPYTGPDDPAARYATGSVPFGPPWLVRIPTSLVVLSDERAKLDGIV